MLQERQNNNPEWIKKLDALDLLPGEVAMDINPAWDRLHQRLGEKKRNKTIAWYWAAAAVMIISLGIIFIPAGIEAPAVAKKETGKKQIPFIKDSVPQPVNTYNKQNTAYQPVDETKSRHKKLSSSSIISLVPEKNLQPVVSPASIIAAIPDTAKTEVASAVPEPPKKKLRVVHINQIDNYIEQKITEDLFTTNSKDGLIKIKISPSN